MRPSRRTGRWRAPVERFLAYGLAGCSIESAFSTALTGRRDGHARVHGPSTVWMLPIYGLAMPLFEIVHDAVRQRPAWQRGSVYAAGILGVEAATGLLLKRVTGRIPWDYSGSSPFAVAGLIRLDYAPLWAGLGLTGERLHDQMVGRSVS
jgi:hypothetical protein